MWDDYHIIKGDNGIGTLVRQDTIYVNKFGTT